MNRRLSWSFLLSVLCLPALGWASGPSADGSMNLVSAIGLAIVTSGLLVLVFNALHLPALLAYIMAGLVLAALAAPVMSGAVEMMGHVSHLGLVFLLFIIGLEMDLHGILRLGLKTAFAVLFQAPIAIAAVLGFQYAAAHFGYALPGLGTATGSFFFYAVACALGSTAVVVKLLADRFDLSSQAGRITVLTLIAQDIWAVLALSYVASAAGGSAGDIVLMIGGGIVVTLVLYLFSRFFLSRLLVTLAKAPDLMALVSLSWCFFCTQAFAWVGLSAEMGALIAGLTIGALPQHIEVLAKVESLRDFFMALFFVALGMTLPTPTLAILVDAVALVAVVIAVRLLLFAPSLFLCQLGPIVSLTAPINLAQISEFTLLLIPIGLAAGSLSEHQASVISYGLMLSVIVTTFAVEYNYRLAGLFASLLPGKRKIPDQSNTLQGQSADGEHVLAAEVALLGFFHNAEALALELGRTAPELIKKILVIDYNLQNHETIMRYGLQVAYGDISNPQSLRHHGIGNVKVVLSTISDAFLRGTSNAELAKQVRNINPAIRFIATADNEASAAALLNTGVFRTVVPPAKAAPTYARALHEALNENDQEAL